MRGCRLLNDKPRSRGKSLRVVGRALQIYSATVPTNLLSFTLRRLKREDVDLEAGAMFVRRSVSEDEGGPVIREETKTSAGRRLELLPVTVESLKKHRLRQNEERLRYRGLWLDLGLIFPYTTGTIMRRNNLHRRSYKHLLKRAGLPDIRLYDLRHTFATLMFENKEQLKLVSEMLGHASVKQTADTYTHVSPTMHREAPCASMISSRGTSSEYPLW
jgi:integrase